VCRLAAAGDVVDESAAPQSIAPAAAVATSLRITFSVSVSDRGIAQSEPGMQHFESDTRHHVIDFRKGPGSDGSSRKNATPRAAKRGALLRAVMREN
jgi:hypothetical protein